MNKTPLIIVGVLGAGLIGYSLLANGTTTETTQSAGGNLSSAVQPPNNANTPANDTVNNYYNIEAPNITPTTAQDNMDDETVVPTTLTTNKKSTAVQSSQPIAQKLNGDLVYADAGKNAVNAFAKASGTEAKLNPTGQSIAPTSKKEEKTSSYSGYFSQFIK